MSHLQLTPVEMRGRRVLTTCQLAELYEADEKRISENFIRNQDRYVLGMHYLLLEGEALREFKREYANCGIATNINRLYLWTEKGALLHAKSLNTDKAWAVYDMLVESYFRVRQAFAVPQTMAEALRLAADQAEQLEKQQKQLEEARPKVLFADAVSASKDSILVHELAKIIKQNGVDTGQQRLFKWLRQNGYLMRARDGENLPTQRAMELGLFEIHKVTIQVPDRDPKVRSTTKVTPKGQQYFINKLLKDKAVR